MLRQRLFYVLTILMTLLNMEVKAQTQMYSYKYPRPAVTADCIVMTRTGKVLLIQRKFPPFKDLWAFPGGFLNMDETTEDCSKRELQEETGLQVKSVTLVGVYSKVDRDPRSRVITTAYITLLDDVAEVKGDDDAANALWFSIDDLPPLAFDHAEIMHDALILYRRLLSE